MSKQFFMHVNNHAQRKSIKRMTTREYKKAQPSFTVAGVLTENLFYFGVAKCSKDDAFNKQTGRELALVKAGLSSGIEIPEYILRTGELGKFFVTRAKRLIKAKKINNDQIRLH